MNIIVAILRNPDMLFENLKFYSNLVQNLLDLEIARIPWVRNFRNWPYHIHVESISFFVPTWIWRLSMVI